MAETITITSAPPANPGLDYTALVAEGIELVQQYAGEIWTDYNQSDPGVTTIEQVCYALTDINYRAEFPLPDLLAGPDGRIHARRHALHSAQRIFPCNPLTERDYRKLFLDRIPALGNVWLRPHHPQSSRGVNGLYDVLLYAPSLQPPPCAPADEERALRDRVRRIYGRHRNVCEDLRSIEVAHSERATVIACVNIADAPRPETILANLLFRASLLFAPEPRREPLSSLVARGDQPSAIFNGPLLLHGFIDDGELQPKAESIRVQELVRTLAGGVGVQSLRDVRIRTMGREYPAAGATIDIPRRVVLRVDTRPDARRNQYSIRLFRAGIEVRPDPGRVQRDLDRLWTAHRRTYRLSAEYEQYFGFPGGTWRNLETYSSIQDQFPAIYGINEQGVESGAPVVRQAEARQFKGYLMVFDQLLANACAQLAHAKQLYSIGGGVPRTYFFQSLRKSVPGVAPLLMPDYESGLQRLVAGDDDAIARRNRFVDYLLALYAEGLDDASVWGNDLLAAKLQLLRRIVPVTHNRGRAVDYLERATPGNLTGMELKIRMQLGMDVFRVRPFVEVAGELGIEIVETDSGTLLLRNDEVIELQFTVVVAEEVIEPARNVTIPAGLLDAKGEELRVGRLPGDNAWSVVWRDAEGWRLAGRHKDRHGAVAAAAAFVLLLRELRRHRQQLYIVEHTLLRHGRHRAKQQDFAYSFTATAVLTDDTKEYREFVRQVIRENAPAHVVMDDLFLRPRQMQRFERLYWPWRRALRQQERREIIRTSAELRAFLERHGETP